MTKPDLCPKKLAHGSITQADLGKENYLLYFSLLTRFKSPFFAYTVNFIENTPHFSLHSILYGITNLKSKMLIKIKNIT